MLNKDASPEAIEKYNKNLERIEKELTLIDVEYRLQEGTVEVMLPKGRLVIGVTTEKWTYLPNPIKGRYVTSALKFIMEKL